MALIPSCTMEKQLIVGKEHAGQRLDKFLSSRLDFLSRTKIHSLIKEGFVLVDGEVRKAGLLIHQKQRISIILKEEKKELKPFDFTVKIIYEDSDIIVIDKPPGLVVHPPHESCHKTLVNALVYLKKELSSPADALRPGVVHRLDKETSGVMVLVKNEHSYNSLVAQFKERKVSKEYRAIVWGKIKKEKMLIDLPLTRDTKNRLKMKVSFLKAKQARTGLEVLERLEDSTYLSLRPRTGRMHQIRVHLKFLGFPIVGDKKYGIKDDYKELFLHAKELSFVHPRGTKLLKFQSALPDKFSKFIAEHKIRQ